MNAEKITLGEMGYRDPANETLSGMPMPFMMRDVMTYSRNLADVRHVIQNTVGTNSYIFVMSDGKTGEAELYVKDRERFLVFQPGQEIHDDKEHLLPIEKVVYGGRYNDKLTEKLTEYHGKLTPEIFMKEIIPHVVMKSNFQNVIYEPNGLKFWVTNSRDSKTLASEGPYTYFDLGAALRDFTGVDYCAKS